MQSEKRKDTSDKGGSGEGDDPADGYPGEKVVLLIFASLEINRVPKVRSREVNMVAPAIPNYLNLSEMPIPSTGQIIQHGCRIRDAMPLW